MLAKKHLKDSQAVRNKIIWSDGAKMWSFWPQLSLSPLVENQKSLHHLLNSVPTMKQDGGSIRLKATWSNLKYPPLLMIQPDRAWEDLEGRLSEYSIIWVCRTGGCNFCQNCLKAVLSKRSEFLSVQHCRFSRLQRKLCEKGLTIFQTALACTSYRNVMGKCTNSVKKKKKMENVSTMQTLCTFIHTYMCTFRLFFGGAFPVLSITAFKANV